MRSKIEGLDDLSMTTNGILLAEQAATLRQAGLRRLNVSLDTLDEATFVRISRRTGLDRVIAGIDAAVEAGFESIKLNALAIRGITEDELIRLVRFASQRGVSIRFIEFMPLDADRLWRKDDVLTGDECLRILSGAFDGLQQLDRPSVSQPAESFTLLCDGKPFSLGIIRSVSEPFCGNCNRLRLTADGSLRNCLFATNETPLRDAMRSGANDDQLIELIQQCVAAKRAAHGMDHSAFTPPERAMYSIGG